MSLQTIYITKFTLFIFTIYEYNKAQISTLTNKYLLWICYFITTINIFTKMKKIRFSQSKLLPLRLTSCINNNLSSLTKNSLMLTKDYSKPVYTHYYYIFENSNNKTKKNTASVYDNKACKNIHCFQGYSIDFIRLIYQNYTH